MGTQIRRSTRLEIEDLEERRVLSGIGLGITALGQTSLVANLGSSDHPLALALNVQGYGPTLGSNQDHDGQENSSGRQNQGDNQPISLNLTVGQTQVPVLASSPGSPATFPTVAIQAGNNSGGAALAYKSDVRDASVDLNDGKVDGETGSYNVISASAQVGKPAALQAKEFTTDLFPQDYVRSPSGTQVGLSGVPVPAGLNNDNSVRGQQLVSVVVGNWETEGQPAGLLVEPGDFSFMAVGAESNQPLVREKITGNLEVAAGIEEGMPIDEGAMGSPLAQEADLLTTVVPVNQTALDLAIQQFLGQVNDIGHELSLALTQRGWLPWAMGATLAGAAALAITRRQVQRRQSGVVLGLAGTNLSWVPGLPGSLSHLDEA